MASQMMNSEQRKELNEFIKQSKSKKFWNKYYMWQERLKLRLKAKKHSNPQQVNKFYQMLFQQILMETKYIEVVRFMNNEDEINYPSYEITIKFVELQKQGLQSINHETNKYLQQLGTQSFSGIDEIKLKRIQNRVKRAKCRARLELLQNCYKHGNENQRNEILAVWSKRLLYIKKLFTEDFDTTMYV